MANPDPYVVGYSFSGFQASAPQTPLPAPALDTELADIAAASQATITALADIRRADGALKNEIVTRDSLAPDIVLGVDSAISAAASATSAAASAVSASASLVSEHAAEAAADEAEAFAVMAGAQIYDFGLLSEAAVGEEDWGTL